MSAFVVEFRKRVTVNTDPLGRCYNGAFASSEEAWAPWEEVAPYPTRAMAESSAATFQRINPKEQYRITEEADATAE